MTNPPATVVWTLGHSRCTFDEYVEILQDHDIRGVVDIRSKPITRFTPQFTKDNFRSALEEAGFEYRFLGDRLGNMPNKPEYFDDDGHTRFAAINDEPWFQAAIDEVVQMAATQTIALTCLEEEPERCHRHLLLGKVLADRGVDVQHIRHAGYVESQIDLDKRVGVKPSWFTDAAWRSPMPMRNGHNKA